MQGWPEITELYVQASHSIYRLHNPTEMSSDDSQMAITSSNLDGVKPLDDSSALQRSGIQCGATVFDN